MKEIDNPWKTDAIEPHCITICGREYDDVEENIFTITWGKLFTNMTTDERIYTRPIGEVCPNLNFVGVDKEAYLDFAPIEISKHGYDFVYDKFISLSHKHLRILDRYDKVSKEFALFSSVDRHGNKIRCKFLPSNLKCLLYFGVKEGGCFFNVMASLWFKTAVHQRLYRFLKSFENRKDKDVAPYITFDILQRDYNVNYSFARFVRRTLKPFLKLMEENPYCDIIADVSIITDENQKGRGRKKVTKIEFIIKKKPNPFV